MHRLMRRMLPLSVVVPGIACDQITKAAAVTHLQGAMQQVYLGGVFHLRYAENPGAMMSVGEHLPTSVRVAVVALVTIALFGALAWTFWSARATALQAASVALVVAGGFGNVCDRIANQGRVVDFMQLAVGPFHSGIFNVADVAIVVGAVACIIAFGTARAPTPN